MRRRGGSGGKRPGVEKTIVKLSCFFPTWSGSCSIPRKFVLSPPSERQRRRLDARFAPPLFAHGKAGRRERVLVCLSFGNTLSLHSLARPAAPLGALLCNMCFVRKYRTDSFLCEDKSISPFRPHGRVGQDGGGGKRKFLLLSSCQHPRYALLFLPFPLTDGKTPLRTLAPSPLLLAFALICLSEPMSGATRSGLRPCLSLSLSISHCCGPFVSAGEQLSFHQVPPIEGEWLTTETSLLTWLLEMRHPGILSSVVTEC